MGNRWFHELLTKIFFKEVGKENFPNPSHPPGVRVKIKINKNILDGWGRKKNFFKRSRQRKFPEPVARQGGVGGGYNICENIIKKKVCVLF